MKVLALLIAAISLLAAPALAKKGSKKQKYLVDSPCTRENDGGRTCFARMRKKTKGRDYNTRAHSVLECKNSVWRMKEDCIFRRCIADPLPHCAQHDEKVYEMPFGDNIVVELDPIDESGNDYYSQEEEYDANDEDRDDTDTVAY